MLKCFLTGLLLVATPATVFAQSTKSAGETAGSNTGTSAGSSSSPSPSPSGNLNNPQAQANMAGQPSNARTVPSSGDAKKIPTPVVPGHPMASVPGTPGVPRSTVVR